MDFLRTHKKICSAVAALMVAVLVVYCYGSFRSYAAAPEVSTLPADDIGAEVAYDADSITLNYNGDTYVFNRHMSFDELISDLESVDELDSSLLYKVQHVKGSGYLYWYVSSNNRYKVDFESGCYLERPSRDGSSYVSPVSYWLSPSHNCVYILYDDVYGNRSSIIVRSYSNGSFYYVLNPDSSLSPYWFDNNSLCYDLSTRSFNFNVAHYPDYIGCFMTDSSRSAGNIGGYPTDLVCIFSNYEISGFYEIDTSKVNTPSYYFKFQYIFYKEGFGYIFVDSAKRVREVGFPNNVNNPRFYFDSECNSYVYTSKDGISWSLLSTESNMYAKWFEVSCNYEFTDYTLVYTNDKNFGGDPLVTPDWGDFSDVIEKLPDITDVYDNLLSHKTDKQTTALTGINKFMYNIVSGLTSNIGLGGLYDSIVSSIKGDSYTYSLSEYMLTNLNNDLSVSLVYDYAEIDGEAWEVPRVTLYGYIVHIDKTLNNLLSNFNNLINISDSRLKSIYQNITLSNQYLKRIFDSIDSLSIPAAAPDYFSQFDKLSAALDKLHNDLIYEEGVTKLPNVPQYLVYIYGVTKDIRTKLDNINVQISDDIVTFRKAVIARFDPVAEKLDSIIAKIPSTSGGGSFDDSNMVGSIVSLKADISDNFTTLIKLLKNDTDGVEGIADLTSFLTTYVVSMGNAAYFTTLLDFADGVKNNVVLINETMVTMVTDSGIFAPVFTLGAGFAVFSGLIRKERMG